MFYLNVPYAEKDKASGLGAKWDGKQKKWYVPEEIDLEPFREWIPIESLSLAEEIIKSQQPDKGVKLSALLTKVKRAIEDNMAGTYWLNAEIANLQMHNGNLYLQLAEMDSNGKEICTSRAIVWRNDLNYIQQKFQSETGNQLVKGLKVLVKVKVSYQIKYQMSLVVVDIDPSFTLGGMEAKVKKIRDRIVALGLYDKNKNFVMPDYFKNVAVVSPNDAAGLGDFKADADKLESYGICNFHYYTAIFQGNSASKTVSDAIKKASFDSLNNGYDAIVVIRGGGAKTDLHFLNEFDIAKQLAESKVPVFVGVGHERDRVFIDEIAFRSFDTPSKVIGFISNNNISLAKKIKEEFGEINHVSRRLFDNIKKSVDTNVSLIQSGIEKTVISYKSLTNDYYKNINEAALKKTSSYKVSFEDNISKIRMAANNKKTNYMIAVEDKTSAIKLKANTEIKSLQTKLTMEYNNIFTNAQILSNSYKSSLNKISSDIDLISPLNALNNGFAIIRTTDGKVIKTLKELEKEESFNVWMQDGEKEFKTGEK